MKIFTLTLCTFLYSMLSLSTASAQQAHEVILEIKTPIWMFKIDGDSSSAGTSIGYWANVGYRIHPNISLHLGKLDSGWADSNDGRVCFWDDVDDELQCETTDSDLYQRGIYAARVEGYTFAAKAELPVNRFITLWGSAGIFNWDSQIDNQQNYDIFHHGESTKDSGTDAFFSTGVYLNLGPVFFFNIDAAFFQQQDVANTRWTSTGERVYESIDMQQSMIAIGLGFNI